ncbi:MAG: glycosyltransferase [Methylacidiphilales bacterium]|nr:glycosyltransferase [Candidatus Methylacidiphilales bacterium]
MDTVASESEGPQRTFGTLRRSVFGINFLRRKFGPLKVPNTASSDGRRVLILSTSAGTGHVRAAEALEKVFRLQPGVGEVRNVDALRFTNKLFRDFYSKLYIQLVQKAPTVLGWVYNSTDEPWKTDRMRLMLDRLNTGPLERFIARYKPDITVCTHFLPAEIISYLISKGKLNARLSIVVTDFDVHAMWLCRTFHRYFVALEESKVHLQVLGLPEQNITVSGIPIDPAFSQKEDRSLLRAQAGFDSERPLFLISGGALGVSPAAGVLEGLSRLRHPAQAVVICGKNPDLQADLEKQVRAIEAVNPALSFKVLGYTNEMHRWMQMSDLFIGKPGGLTTAESLASGLPMVIVAPIPGQEDRNSDHLLEKGIAMKCNEFTTLAYKIDGLLDQPAQLEAMRTKALAYGRPRAAETIVETLMNQPVEEEAAQVVPGN